MPSTDETRIPINRHLVGFAAFLCLGGAAVLWMIHPESGPEENTWELLKSACTRVGLVMAALWIALPRTGSSVEVSPKVLLAGLAAFVGAVLRPRFVIPLLLILAVLTVILRPREKNRRQHELRRKYRKEGGGAASRSDDSGKQE